MTNEIKTFDEGTSGPWVQQAATSKVLEQIILGKKNVTMSLVKDSQSH